MTRKTKKELEKELKDLKEKIKELEEEKLRAIADIQNLQKRFEREKERYRQEGIKTALLKIADVLDLTINALTDAARNSDESYARGFNLLSDQLTNSLKELGLHLERPVGEKFDYRRHHAVGMVETDDHEEGTIVEVLRCGVVFNNEVLRPAVVRVAKHGNES